MRSTSRRGGPTNDGTSALRTRSLSIRATEVETRGGLSPLVFALCAQHGRILVGASPTVSWSWRAKCMVDDGLGFSLVPWTPSVEKHIGQHVSGVVRADGGIDWSFGRKRGLGL
ncbi:DUF3363 domain-containing protein [Rhizobium leguminosarum]|uniref:DUF3363 domain-containing protein n=1 Tax=Rhizobium leguminosarum TaxID=384 RepID=UPI0021BC0E3E|nr:DUF3363 domain-containing protein [Rhizobium leguminosarum]